MTEGPHEIDCREALDRLYEYLDAELTPELAQEVADHLAKCAPCLAVSKFETAYLRFLEARTRAQGAPDDLKKRILERLLFDKDAPGGS
ncbi:MAG: mycothiol system anti-sigma-R factor [Gemmatimonadales bacterium]|nr:mycothiol system anti-sigma-R factor [Gemmatimonadales bacterium]NIN12843.1 mycothiol system anti-sigma-R factor [Gemmatimonadales bacterium]NIN51021.1 mycothiol system anti-sigma-R factor [Gemmatimonadales bacterium]NIP08485.1 mycothiol system anti-sigma-R factor [Gemmatimonadales bacterium]NIR02525.1 mycothiol system anti-sigma-R factor [Gemmatimonadales bacterium]